MTRSEQLALAAEILGQSVPARKISIEVTFVRRLKKAKSSPRYGTTSKRHKGAADSLARALRRLQAVLRSNAFADDARPRSDFPFDDVNLTGWIEIAERAARQPLRQHDPSSQAKRYAVDAAAKLLGPSNLKATRKGKWCKLAAVLYGDEHIDLYHYVAAAKSDRKGA